MVDEEREREKKTRIYVFVRSSTTVYCFKTTSLTCKYISRAILLSIPLHVRIQIFPSCCITSSPQNLLTFLLRDSHQTMPPPPHPPPPSKKKRKYKRPKSSYFFWLGVLSIFFGVELLQNFARYFIAKNPSALRATEYHESG